MKALAEPSTSASAALPAANRSVLPSVARNCRAPSTPAKLSRPSRTPPSGAVTVTLPCNRKTNGGSTRAHSTSSSSAARIREGSRVIVGAALCREAAGSARAWNHQSHTQSTGLFGSGARWPKGGCRIHSKLRLQASTGGRASESAGKDLLQARSGLRQVRLDRAQPALQHHGCIELRSSPDRAEPGATDFLTPTAFVHPSPRDQTRSISQHAQPIAVSGERAIVKALRVTFGPAGEQRGR